PGPLEGVVDVLQVGGHTVDEDPEQEERRQPHSQVGVGGLEDELEQGRLGQQLVDHLRALMEVPADTLGVAADRRRQEGHVGVTQMLGVEQLVIHGGPIHRKPSGAKTEGNQRGFGWMKKSLRVTSGATESVSTPVTWAAGGPCQSQSTSRSHASGSPCAHTSTRPSGRLRTQPTNPRDLATWRQLCR